MASSSARISLQGDAKLGMASNGQYGMPHGASWAAGKTDQRGQYDERDAYEYSNPVGDEQGYYSDAAPDSRARLETEWAAQNMDDEWGADEWGEDEWASPVGMARGVQLNRSPRTFEDRWKAGDIDAKVTHKLAAGILLFISACVLGLTALGVYLITEMSLKPKTLDLSDPGPVRICPLPSSGAFLRICRLTPPRVWLVSDAAVSCQLYWELGRLYTVQRRLWDARFSAADVCGYYRCGWHGKFLSAG